MGDKNKECIQLTKKKTGNMSDSKRKVLFVVESLDEGRVGRALSVIVQYIDKSKFDVTVCAINGGGAYEAVIRENANYKAVLTEPGGLKRKMVYRTLPLSLVYSFYIPHGNDVEVACSEGFVTKLLSHASKGNVKRYALTHTDFEKNHWTKEIFNSVKEETVAYNKFDKVIGATGIITKSFRNQFPDVKVPVETIYDPIDSLSVRLKSLNASSGDEEPVKTRIVSQGRLESRYEYSRLIRIVERLIKEGYDLGLWIFGEGSEHGILDHYIRKNDLQKRVKLFGAHPNPYRYMVQGDIFVCSVCGSGVIKALILGLPIVATDTPELNELLKNGESALITPDTEEDLYTGIKRMLDEPELLEQYRQKGEARGWDFDIEALMVPVENLLMN